MEDRPDPLAPPEGYGRKPGWQPEPVASLTCTHDSGTCPAEPAVLVRLGCIGEHIAELYFCAPHWARISTEGASWSCHGLAGEGKRICGNPMRVEKVEMLAAGAAREVAAEVMKLQAASGTAMQKALSWATDGQPAFPLKRWTTDRIS